LFLIGQQEGNVTNTPEGKLGGIGIRTMTTWQLSAE